MIPEIGIILALYIITRCASFINLKSNPIVVILSILTILITGIALIDFAIKGLSGFTMPAPR